MGKPIKILETERLRLRPWHERHRAAFIALHADPEVMVDQGGPLTRSQSNEKFERYCDVLTRYGTSRWAVEDHEGQFIGYAGVMLSPTPRHPLGRHYEMAWRFVRKVWGAGYASESSIAALEDAFKTLCCSEIMAYTSASNLRSQAVMRRLGLTRDPSRDFEARSKSGLSRRALVWVAEPGLFGLAPRRA